MATFASTSGTPSYDGLPYATAAVIPSVEQDLFNQPLPQKGPLSVVYGEAALAVIELSLNVQPATNSTYVILQTDLGDGVWLDLVGIVWTGTSGSATFLLSAGVAGALALQQTRQAGSAPGANFANQCPLGGRIRFVGQTTLTGVPANFSSSGGVAGVTCTIRVKLLGLR
jgi:hypothetical protein